MDRISRGTPMSTASIGRAYSIKWSYHIGVDGLRSISIGLGDLAVSLRDPDLAYVASCGDVKTDAR